MMHRWVWLGLVLGVMGVTARYLPTPDLIVDSLMPISLPADNERLKRDVEGSGDDQVVAPINAQLNTHFQRLVQTPEDDAKNGLEEGSGSPPDDTEVLKHVEDSFAKELGMDDVIEDLKKPSGLPTEDDNLQGNSLNVLPSEERPDPRPEEEDTAQPSVDEGSGAEPEIEIDSTQIAIIGDSDETEDLRNDTSRENITMTHVESVKIATTEITSVEISSEENVASASSTEMPLINTGQGGEVSSEEQAPAVIEIEVASSTPAIAIDMTSPEDIVPTTEQEATIHQITSTDLPLLPVNVENPSAKPDLELSSTTEHFIEDISSTMPNDVEIINKATGSIKLASAIEAVGKSLGDEDGSSYQRTLSTYIIIGVLVIAFVSLTAFLVIRRKRNARVPKKDDFPEEETGKALLSNGKYKPENDDVKNNEISPLVINKFEKSPNFSSQKNINSIANDKNIEKDNVLKQAIIEDEFEADGKKSVEDGEEIKKLEEPKNEGDPEKVVVRSHIDLDSIPRKPLIVNRNGNTYHSIPNGESNT